MTWLDLPEAHVTMIGRCCIVTGLGLTQRRIMRPGMPRPGFYSQKAWLYDDFRLPAVNSPAPKFVIFIVL